ncbi:hypothetical protein VdG1_09534, partial [Verticillium dahliae VDG1]
ALRVAGLVLQPFMPGKMGEMLDILGVQPARRTFAYATFGGDVEYGARKEAAPLPRGKWTGLFPPAVATE